FEPASLVKTIHNLHIMRQVQAGERLSSNFVYYNYPNSPFNAGTSNACPIPSDEVAANQINSTLDFGKDRMMTISDNRTTRGITLRYGLPAINATAQWAGMASTDVDQDQVGCGWLGGKRNDTTLSDIGRLFEGVENGTFLGTGSFRTEFYQPMTGNAFNTTSGVENNIITVVNEEAAKQGKSAIADDFVAGMNWRTKGGSYSIPCDQAGCAIGSIYVRSLGGRLTLPTKTSATTFGERDYVFGRFVNDLRINCTECPPQAPADAALVQVDKELFREVIASALQSW
ncbi:MAG TPA: serine hydrolase, partial [Acidimicrobiales bacterium]